MSLCEWMNLLLQTWISRGRYTGHPGLSCQWEQAFPLCQQQPEGDIIIMLTVEGPLLFHLEMHNVHFYKVPICNWNVAVPLPPRVCLLPFLSVCVSAACCSYQDTELFEIIEKLQVSYNHIDLLLCVMSEQRKFLIINTPLVHQGSRIDEQRCEFPLPLKVRLQSESLYMGLIPCVCVGVDSDLSMNAITFVSPNNRNDKLSSLSSSHFCLF